MKLLPIILLIAVIQSCNNRENSNVNGNEKKIDTLGVSYDSIFPKNFSRKFHYENGENHKVYVGKKITYKLEFKKGFQRIMENCDLTILPFLDENLVEIKKIDNQTFELFLDSTISKKVLTLKYFISPHSHYVLYDQDFNRKYGTLSHEQRKKYPEFYKEKERMEIFITANKVE